MNANCVILERIFPERVGCCERKYNNNNDFQLVKVEFISETIELQSTNRRDFQKKRGKAYAKSVFLLLFED